VWSRQPFVDMDVSDAFGGRVRASGEIGSLSGPVPGWPKRRNVGCRGTDGGQAFYRCLGTPILGVAVGSAPAVSGLPGGLAPDAEFVGPRASNGGLRARRRLWRWRVVQRAFWDVLSPEPSLGPIEGDLLAGGSPQAQCRRKGAGAGWEPVVSAGSGQWRIFEARVLLAVPALARCWSGLAGGPSRFGAAYRALTSPDVFR